MKILASDPVVAHARERARAEGNDYAVIETTKGYMSFVEDAGDYLWLGAFDSWPDAVATARSVDGIRRCPCCGLYLPSMNHIAECEAEAAAAEAHEQRHLGDRS